MNKSGLLHIPDTRYAFVTSKNTVILRVRTAIEDNDVKLSVIYGAKHSFTEARKYLSMNIKYQDAFHNYYECKLVLDDFRLAYIFEIYDEEKKYYYSEDGLTENYNFSTSFYSYFQIAYLNEVDIMPVIPWMQKALFYQIFVDRFCRGNFEKKSEYIDMKWNDIPSSKSFAGGDLEGIRLKLPYLKDLGVNALYLTPIFQAGSNHKYDTIDYYKIDSHFGNKNDLINLVKDAHKQNFKIILDAVFNHCSSSHERFCDVCRNGKKSPYYNWFIVDGDFPDVNKGNYQRFASVNNMPKLDTSNKEVQKYLIDIAKTWTIECDVDGWRLDVSDEVSHDFWKQFRKEIKKIKKDCVIIGENWHDSYPYLKGDELDSVMNYAFTNACQNYFASKKIGTKEMANRLNNILMRNTDMVNNMIFNLLDSHDTSRFYSLVNKSEGKFLAAIALLLVYIGTPCIYYGTEIATEGGHDPDSRRCFDWDAEKQKTNLHKSIKKILKLKKYKVLQGGDIQISSKNNSLIVKRENKSYLMELLINLEDKIDFPKENIIFSYEKEISFYISYTEKNT